MHLAIYAEAYIVGFEQYFLPMNGALTQTSAACACGARNIHGNAAGTCRDSLRIGVANENLPRREMLDMPILSLGALDGAMVPVGSSKV